MRLSQILPADCDALDASADVVIEGLALDSRFVHPGEVFVALSGGQVRGQDFIEMALERGACAVLTGRLKQSSLSRWFTCLICVCAYRRWPQSFTATPVNR